MMDFDRWFAKQRPHDEPKKVKQLTADAQADRNDFERKDPEYGRLSDRGCTCFLGCAPCLYCTHPGNPLNQEIDEAWELVHENEVTRDTE